MVIAIVFMFVLVTIMLAYHRIIKSGYIHIYKLDIVILAIIQLLYMMLAILTNNTLLFYVALLFALFYIFPMRNIR